MYTKRLNSGKVGAGNKPARMIIGFLVIKHKMNLSDEETILSIQENPYMQYFVGLSEFTDKLIFDSSLFVTIRKHLGTSDFNDMSLSLLTLQVENQGLHPIFKLKTKTNQIMRVVFLVQILPLQIAKEDTMKMH